MARRTARAARVVRRDLQPRLRPHRRQSRLRSRSSNRFATCNRRMRGRLAADYAVFVFRRCAAPTSSRIDAARWMAVPSACQTPTGLRALSLGRPQLPRAYRQELSPRRALQTDVHVRRGREQSRSARRTPRPICSPGRRARSRSLLPFTRRQIYPFVSYDLWLPNYAVYRDLGTFGQSESVRLGPSV